MSFLKNQINVIFRPACNLLKSVYLTLFFMYIAQHDEAEKGFFLSHSISHVIANGKALVFPHSLPGAPTRHIVGFSSSYSQ